MMIPSWTPNFRSFHDSFEDSISLGRPSNDSGTRNAKGPMYWRCIIPQKRGNRHRGRRSKLESVWNVERDAVSVKKRGDFPGEEIMEGWKTPKGRNNSDMLWTHSGRMSVQMGKRPSHLLPHIRTPDLTVPSPEPETMQRPCACHHARMGQTLPCLCRPTSFPISTSQIWAVLSETKRLPPNTAAITAAGISVWAVSHSFPTIPRYPLHCNKIWIDGHWERDPERSRLFGVETQPPRGFWRYGLNWTWTTHG